MHIVKKDYNESYTLDIIQQSSFMKAFLNKPGSPRGNIRLWISIKKRRCATNQDKIYLEFGRDGSSNKVIGTKHHLLWPLWSRHNLTMQLKPRKIKVRILLSHLFFFNQVNFHTVVRNIQWCKGRGALRKYNIKSFMYICRVSNILPRNISHEASCFATDCLQ